MGNSKNTKNEDIPKEFTDFTKALFKDANAGLKGDKSNFLKIDKEKKDVQVDYSAVIGFLISQYSKDIVFNEFKTLYNNYSQPESDERLLGLFDEFCTNPVANTTFQHIWNELDINSMSFQKRNQPSKDLNIPESWVETYLEKKLFDPDMAKNVMGRLNTAVGEMFRLGTKNQVSLDALSEDMAQALDQLIIEFLPQSQTVLEFAGLVQAGELRTEHIYGEIGEIVAGLKPGRESQVERILFWHKGFAISDIMLGTLAYQKAREKGVGTLLAYYKDPRDM